MRRFEADASGFLFRASPTATPVRVSASEVERERAAFRNGVMYLGWGLVAGTMLLCVALALFDLDLGAPSDQSLLAQSLGAGFVALFFSGWWWLWRAPDRRFRRHPPGGATRSDDEARTHALQTLGWSHVGLSAGLGLVLLGRLWDGEWLLPAVGGFALATAIRTTARKLRMP